MSREFLEGHLGAGGFSRLAVGVKEAAFALGVSQKQVRDWIARGELRAFKAGKRTLIRVEELEGFVRRLEEEAPAHGRKVK